MKFSLAHEIDAPPDAVELAVLSPDLPQGILRELGKLGGPRIESVETVVERFEGGAFDRLLRYQAAASFPALERVLRGKRIAREMMRWEERFGYARATRTASWKVSPMPEYAKWFDAHGTWRLETIDNGRTRRTVEGELAVHVRLVGAVLERIAVAEVKKTYDAEAAALRALAIF